MGKRIFKGCRIRGFWLLAALVVCMTWRMIPAQAVYADEGDCVSYEGTNLGGHNYYNTLEDAEIENDYYHASTIRSYLVECADGRYMVVQYGDMGVVVEYYDAEFRRLSSQVLPEELPIFGGFYAVDGNYYLLTGQRNPDELASVECFRLTKYDSSWKRLGSAGLSDCNTTYPFLDGARMVSVGKYLVVRTCHHMYKAKDGLNHQANCTIEFDTERMEVTDHTSNVSNPRTGYVSHSFNQFVEEEDGKIIGVDHGDAHPRAITGIPFQNRKYQKKLK